MVTLRTRTTGATANAKAREAVSIVTPTGGALTVATGVNEPGFNPLDLLYASLAACLTLSARHAATRQGVIGRIGEIRVEVAGDKAHEGPSRVETITLRLVVTGDVTPEERTAILEEAEQLCTVSNTLAAGPKLAFT